MEMGSRKDEDYDGRASLLKRSNLIVYALLPEETDVANNFREINEVFEDYIDKFLFALWKRYYRTRSYRCFCCW